MKDNIFTFMTKQSAQKITLYFTLVLHKDLTKQSKKLA